MEGIETKLLTAITSLRRIATKLRRDLPHPAGSADQHRAPRHA
jgi:hypothetical protein